jgi:hypothetical protein
MLFTRPRTRSRKESSKKSNLTFLFAAAFVSFNPTPSNQCTTVDLREIKPTVMRDQKDISWCFAHASADLIQLTYDVPFQISAADIAISYNELPLAKIIHRFQSFAAGRWSRYPGETGLMKYAMINTIKEGPCPEEYLPSDEWVRTNADGTTEKKSLGKAIPDLLELQKLIQARVFLNEAELPYTYAFKQVSPRRLFYLLKQTPKKQVLNHLRAEACAHVRQFIPIRTATKMAIQNRNIFKTINRELSSHRPTGLDFSSDVFANLDDINKKLSSLHTVLIYGRKFDPETQECQYMLKNSYGTDCDRIDSRLECDSGYVWLPENVVYRTMTSSVRAAPLRKPPEIESIPAPVASSL